MSKDLWLEIFYLLEDELGREPTEEEIQDRLADRVDATHERLKYDGR